MIRVFRRSAPSPRHAARHALTPASRLSDLRARLTQSVSETVTGTLTTTRAELGRNRRSWVTNGIAAGAVTVLGFGVAGSVMVTSNAQSTEGQQVVAAAQQSVGTTAKKSGSKVKTTVNKGVKQTSAFDRKTSTTSRDASRAPLTSASQAKSRTTALGEADLSRAEAMAKKAADRRDAALKADAKQARSRAEKLLDEQNAPTTTLGTTGTTDGTGDTGAAVTGDSSKGSLPITSGYSIAARFGAVGAWSRYHTGIDFSAPMGTPIHAIAAGVITHAGPGGGAGSWAGNYVTIRHADGTQTLYAHQSVVVVSVGQQVDAGTVIGHIGMTGRSFGPHVHVELYPVGVEPGDVYKAIDPAPWMAQHGLSI